MYHASYASTTASLIVSVAGVLKCVAKSSDRIPTNCRGCVKIENHRL